ncbi:MAG: sulfurtransferase-like selenium metabolism protein YedF [Nitrospirae bacterium]|nr:sulfurtransferase-like selenium metabolism protein YedF [Nitrospirota bacterium]
MNAEKNDLQCTGYAGRVKKRLSECFSFCKNNEKILIAVSSDVMGKEEEIGKVLIKGFFETMRAAKELPHTIFFLNAGVKLTTINDETIQILKNIESMGVEIYSCGTCLKYYNLEDKLKAGKRGATNQIIEGIKDFKKVVWI